MAGAGGQKHAKKGKAPCSTGAARRADAAKHDGGKSRLAAGGGPQTPPRNTAQEDAAQAAADAHQRGIAADRQGLNNGATPNGSGGVMTSGQRLLAAQSGASTLDPRRSDE